MRMQDHETRNVRQALERALAALDRGDAAEIADTLGDAVAVAVGVAELAAARAYPEPLRRRWVLAET